MKWLYIKYKIGDGSIEYFFNLRKVKRIKKDDEALYIDNYEFENKEILEIKLISCPF